MVGARNHIWKHLHAKRVTLTRPGFALDGGMRADLCPALFIEAGIGAGEGQLAGAVGEAVVGEVTVRARSHG